ncbi:MAG: hypothetical protein JOZ80_14990 [Acidobacteriaceae bacterium]|nr:hypothetical protein [Acidobacteriaceae bacterium]
MSFPQAVDGSEGRGASTSAFTKLNPIPQFKATVKLREFLESRISQSFYDCGGTGRAAAPIMLFWIRRLGPHLDEPLVLRQSSRARTAPFADVA